MTKQKQIEYVIEIPNHMNTEERLYLEEVGGSIFTFIDCVNNPLHATKFKSREIAESEMKVIQKNPGSFKMYISEDFDLWKVRELEIEYWINYVVENHTPGKKGKL